MEPSKAPATSKMTGKVNNKKPPNCQPYNKHLTNGGLPAARSHPITGNNHAESLENAIKGLITADQPEKQPHQATTRKNDRDKRRMSAVFILDDIR